jgi:hypothetical protein
VVTILMMGAASAPAAAGCGGGRANPPITGKGKVAAASLIGDSEVVVMVGVTVLVLALLAVWA